MGSTRVIAGYPWSLTSDKMKETPAKSEGGATVLSETLLKIAKKELREDKCCREQSLEQLRNWIVKNEDIRNMRFDEQFLLRFLRVKKFSVPMAEQTLLKYLNLRRTFPHMLNQLDYLCPKLNDIITSGYIFASPIRDRNGRRVVITNARHFNPKVYSSSDQARAHFVTYECLIEDEENQILGLTHVGDFSGISTALVTNWNPNEFARVFKWGEQSLPIRHKEIHLVNIPSTLKWLIDFLKTRVSTKIKNRLNCYTSEKELHKSIDRECLPLEMGGRMPMKEMIEAWKVELASKRDLIMALEKIELLSDRGIQTSRSSSSSSSSSSSLSSSSYTTGKNTNGTSFVSQIESVTGSFRKLEFD